MMKSLFIIWHLLCFKGFPASSAWKYIWFVLISNSSCRSNIVSKPEWLSLFCKYTHFPSLFSELHQQTARQSGVRRQSEPALFSHSGAGSPKRLNIHHSYEYLGGVDLQSWQCYEQRSSILCDLGPCGSRIETEDCVKPCWMLRLMNS